MKKRILATILVIAFFVNIIMVLDGVQVRADSTSDEYERIYIKKNESYEIKNNSNENITIWIKASSSSISYDCVTFDGDNSIISYEKSRDYNNEIIKPNYTLRITADYKDLEIKYSKEKNLQVKSTSKKALNKYLIEKGKSIEIKNTSSVEQYVSTNAMAQYGICFDYIIFK